MSIELIPLCTAQIRLAKPLLLEGTPRGTRMIFEVQEASYEGERLRGKLKGAAAADWLWVGPEGTGTLDVRATLETDDGALVFSTYQGRIDLASEERIVYAAPLYDTGDARYAWLNKIQAVAKGRLVDDVLSYEIYELR